MLFVVFAWLVKEYLKRRNNIFDVVGKPLATGGQTAL